MIGGGGGTVDEAVTGEGSEVCVTGRDSGEDGAEGDVSESESFSQTISGDQIRSGSDKTRRGGARSASRCLDSAL